MEWFCGLSAIAAAYSKLTRMQLPSFPSGFVLEAATIGGRSQPGGPAKCRTERVCFAKSRDGHSRQTKRRQQIAPNSRGDASAKFGFARLSVSKKRVRKRRPTLLLLIDPFTMFRAEASTPRVVQDKAEFAAAAVTSVRSHRWGSDSSFNPTTSIRGPARVHWDWPGPDIRSRCYATRRRHGDDAYSRPVGSTLPPSTGKRRTAPWRYSRSICQTCGAPSVGRRNSGTTKIGRGHSWLSARRVTG